MTSGTCVYCGHLRDLTRDHVPPRCLFSKPRPNDLVTVPCCHDCNRELSKHDEYFRIAVTTGIDRERFPRENADSVRAIQNLVRPASQLFARYLLRSYEPSLSRLTFDKHRIEIVLYRVTRGLFFHHNLVCLPSTIAFECCLLDATSQLHDEGQARVDRLGNHLTTIGSGVFRYAFEPFEPPDPFGSAWLMRFYDHKTFFCITASNHCSE
jgi:hypothetical protein